MKKILIDANIDYEYVIKELLPNYMPDVSIISISRKDWPLKEFDLLILDDVSTQDRFDLLRILTPEQIEKTVLFHSIAIANNLRKFANERGVLLEYKPMRFKEVVSVIESILQKPQ